VYVFFNLNQNTTTKRESGRSAQLGNIAAAKAVANIIRSTLGPQSMLKMLLDPMGGIVMTNDGNCILREVRCYILPRELCFRLDLYSYLNAAKVLSLVATASFHKSLRCHGDPLG
jgi:hypothetical protein